jgi:hypothetical protein
MRSRHALRVLSVVGAALFIAAAEPRLLAQVPDIIDGGALLAGPSLKTAPEFNGKASRQMKKPVTIEKAEYPLPKLVEDIEKQSGIKIELGRYRAFGEIVDFSNAKIRFSSRIYGVSVHTCLRLICEQIDGTFWVADNRVILVPEGRILNKLIEETILAQQPVEPRLLQRYFEEIRASRREKDRAARMVESLAAPVDVEPMQKPLSEALEQVRKKSGVNIVLAPTLAGKLSDGRKGHAEELDALITLPDLKGVRLDRLLKIMLNQVNDLTFDVRSDHVFIRKSVDPDANVHVAFDDITLAKAVNELIEQTGKTIVVNLPEADRRKLVSMTVLNETLATTMELLALQVGAKVKRIDRAYVLVLEEAWQKEFKKGADAK